MNRITVTELEPHPGQQWKCGDEYLPFHPQASHVPPEYRDGWNRCYWMAVAAVARATHPAVIVEAGGPLYFQGGAIAHSLHGSPSSTDDGQVNKDTLHALLSRQGCELATDATKQQMFNGLTQEETDATASVMGLVHPAMSTSSVPTAAPLSSPRATNRPARPLGWLADQHPKQEERRCYVCGGRDDGGCHGVDGERAECPWY